MSSVLLLALSIAVLAVHVLALLASRGGSSRLHTWTFVSGLLGILSIPAVLLTFFYGGPLPVVGPTNPGMATAFNMCVGGALALVASSAILGLYTAARRKPQAA